MGAVPSSNDEDYELALKLQQEQEQESSIKKPKIEQVLSDEQFAKMLQEESIKGTRTSHHAPSQDEEFAKSLQAEEKKSNETVTCQSCKAATKMDDLYILDDCTHRFCRSCLKTYVASEIQKSVTLECPLKECHKELSVRDMKDLLPEIQDQENSVFNPTKGSGKATERIMAEFKHISKSDPKKNGYSVSPIGDNLYKWELKLFNFEKDDLIEQDMVKFKVKNILLHVVFPKNYPFSPPYIRVIRPRFQYRTGHVTIGGSICMEILTNKSWSPANTIEAIIVSIRAQLVAGGARLDTSNKHDYTEQEAKEAFDRMVRDHGW